MVQYKKSPHRAKHTVILVAIILNADDREESHRVPAIQKEAVGLTMLHIFLRVSVVADVIRQ